MTEVVVDEDYLWALETLVEGSRPGSATRSEYKDALRTLRERDNYVMRGEIE